MDVRGGSPLPERTILERFLLRLALPVAEGRSYIGVLLT
jgi:hypothetical protein